MQLSPATCDFLFPVRLWYLFKHKFVSSLEYCYKGGLWRSVYQFQVKSKKHNPFEGYSGIPPLCLNLLEYLYFNLFECLVLRDVIYVLCFGLFVVCALVLILVQNLEIT